MSGPAGRESATLRLLTTDPNPENLVDIEAIACNGSMTCPCDACRSKVAARVQRGGRRDDDKYGGMPVKIRRAA
jgi:hypothetical protein